LWAWGLGGSEVRWRGNALEIAEGDMLSPSAAPADVR
jgi:hypothetical protein